MHSAEGAMFPIAKSTLTFGEIADYWSREITPPASWDEILRTLGSAWWLGELRADSGPTRFQRLKNMFSSMRQRDDLGIVFIVGDCAGPLPVKLPDGSLQVDLRHHIRVPSSSTENWDEAACRDAYHALAKTCSKESYPELTVGFTLTELSYEEFSTWCTKRGFPSPTFWKPPDHLVAPKKSKTWQARPGQRLTASEIAVVNVINQISPDGRLDQKASVRDKLIQDRLRLAQQSVSRRTIERTLNKIRFV
jgi:hypothetical protein